jgi:glucose-1-phosphate thymidylyltransferase
VALEPRALPVGVMILSPAALEVAAGLEAERGSLADVDDLPEAVQSSGGRVAWHAAQRGWRSQGNPESLLRVNEVALDQLVATPGAERIHESVEMRGPVVVDPSAHVRTSTVHGPVVIGPRARIEDSYIGPYTAIGADTTIDSSEVEHSVLLSGVHIQSVALRIMGSVIGPEARVDRRFTRPNALRLHLGQGGRATFS